MRTCLLQITAIQHKKQDESRNVFSVYITQNVVNLKSGSITFIVTSWFPLIRIGEGV